MKQNILFIATNGIGLGHLTRSIAIANKVREKSDEIECIFFNNIFGDCAHKMQERVFVLGVLIQTV